MNRLFTCLLLGFLFSGFGLKAQTDLQFSQYMFNLLYINPGYAGYKEQINTTAFYRTQYSGFSGAPTTYSLSVDAPWFSDDMGLGLQINNDKIGIQTNLTASFAYSYRIALTEDSRLCLGLQGGISQFSQNPSLANPDQSGDPLILSGNVNASNFTSRFGLFYYSNLFYLGISASNLYTRSLSDNNPSIQVPAQLRNYYLTAGAFIQINDNLALKPSFLIKSPQGAQGTQGGITTADINCFLLLSNRLWLGTSYRMGVTAFNSEIIRGSGGSQNAVLFLAEFFISEKLRIGYAYDYPLNSLISAKSGSNEFSLGYYLPISRSSFKNSMVTPRYF
jgi:type IX secretion system PorP/SprF family membrane protein